MPQGSVAEFTEEGHAIEVDNLPEVVAEVPMEEVQEAAQEAVQEAQEATEDVVQPRQEQDKEYRNVYARARILERDNSILQERLNIILQNLQNVPQQAQTQAAARVQEEAPDPSLDPIGALMYEIQSIKGQLQQSKMEQLQAAQIGSVQQRLAYADSLIRQSATQNPEMFQAAVAHLAHIVQDQVEDEYPDRTEREKLALVQESIERQKLEWISKGKNPGEEYLKRAYRFGFRWNENTNRQAPSAKPDARTQIREEKARDQKSNSIATMRGAPAKTPTNASQIRKMSDDQFNRWVNDSMKSGNLTAESGHYGRTPGFSQLLPGKGRTVSGSGR